MGTIKESRTSKGAARLVGGIFLVVGLVIASVGGCFVWSTQDSQKACLRATGKVIELRKPPGQRGYTPVVQFETADHKSITAVGKFGSNPPAHNVADSVTVLYRAESPNDISLDDPFELWLVPCILGGIGSIFVIVGGALLFFAPGGAKPGKAG